MTIDDLREQYDCEWLEDRGQFSRVTTEPEQSAWYCTVCGSLDCDPHEDICYGCGEESDDICTSCDGTGEGMHDGATCWSCRGSGVKRRASDYEAEIDRLEYEEEMSGQLEAITKAIAILHAHDATPNTLEVSRATFEALKRDCMYPTDRPMPNTLFGVRIVVKG